jgi:hypothetical protein
MGWIMTRKLRVGTLLGFQIVVKTKTVAAAYSPRANPPAAMPDAALFFSEKLV